MTKIEWTEETWNPIVGCSKVSEGCQNCYAERMAARLARMPQTADLYSLVIDDKRRWKGRTVLVEETLKKPLVWKRPRMIFAGSMCDLFHESVPFEQIDQVLALIARCPQHTFQILTKRPQRMLEYFDDCSHLGFGSKDRISAGIAEYANVPPTEIRRRWPLANLWLGVTAENQARADERIPILLQIAAAVRFVSCEPLLGPVDLTKIKWAEIPVNPADYARHGVPAPQTMWSLNNVLKSRPGDELNQPKIGLDWVIVGCETGSGSRIAADTNQNIGGIVQQCRGAGVPCFVKKTGKLAAGGVTWTKKTDPLPAWAVRQWPKTDQLKSER